MKTKIDGNYELVFSAFNTAYDGIVYKVEVFDNTINRYNALRMTCYKNNITKKFIETSIRIVTLEVVELCQKFLDEYIKEEEEKLSTFKCNVTLSLKKEDRYIYAFIKDTEFRVAVILINNDPCFCVGSVIKDEKLLAAAVEYARTFSDGK